MLEGNKPLRMEVDEECVKDRDYNGKGLMCCHWTASTMIFNREWQ